MLRAPVEGLGRHPVEAAAAVTLIEGQDVAGVSQTNYGRLASALVGGLIGFAVLSFFLVAVMYRRSLPVAAAVAVGLAAGFYAVFPLLLGVNLP